MFIETIKQAASANGMILEKVNVKEPEEKIVLKIVADHNDCDYEEKFTTIKIVKDDEDLDHFFKVINVLKKLVQAKRYEEGKNNWHISELYSSLTEEDLTILHSYDLKHNNYTEAEFNVSDIEEYSIMDGSEWANEGISTIRDWFPSNDDFEHDDNSEHINANHSLIEISMQYHDGLGNILNIVTKEN